MPSSSSRIRVSWRTAEILWTSPWMRVERAGQWHRIMTTNGGVIVVPYRGKLGDPDSRVVAVENFRPNIGRSMLELPRGGRDIGESFEHAAIRECAEETGFLSQSIDPVLVGFVTPDAGMSGCCVPIFACEIPERPASVRDGEVEKVEEIRWVDLPGRIMREGGCGFSLAACAYVNEFVRTPGFLESDPMYRHFMDYDPSAEFDVAYRYDAASVLADEVDAQNRVEEATP